MELGSSASLEKGEEDWLTPLPDWRPGWSLSEEPPSKPTVSWNDIALRQ